MNSESRKRPGDGEIPPDDLVVAVRLAVAADGEKATSKRLGIGRSTVSRLRGGLPCRAGTIALARQRLGLT
jgi:hypothetical protein